MPPFQSVSWCKTFIWKWVSYSPGPNGSKGEWRYSSSKSLSSGQVLNKTTALSYWIVNSVIHRQNQIKSGFSPALFWPLRALAMLLVDRTITTVVQVPAIAIGYVTLLCVLLIETAKKCTKNYNGYILLIPLVLRCSCCSQQSPLKFL